MRSSSAVTKSSYFIQIFTSRMAFTLKSSSLQHIMIESSYTFRTEFWHYSSANEFISTVLQFSQIDCCSNVLFHFISYDDGLVELPVDLVANWLNRSRNSNAINANRQMENERILAIKITGTGWYIGNVSEMLNSLKEVNFNHLILIT